MKENKSMESGYYSLVGLAQKKLGIKPRTESDALAAIEKAGYVVEYNTEARRPFYNVSKR